jgi:hypothetical protein
MIWQGDQNRPPKNQLKRSADKLSELRQQSWEIRQDFLLRLHHQHKSMGEVKKAKAVWNIRKAKNKVRCSRICKSINKPRSAAGGLTHVLIETEQGIERIDDPTEMAKFLLPRNVIHFAQAKNTPCANGKLGELLHRKGLSNITKNALLGILPNNRQTKKKYSDRTKTGTENFDQLYVI